ncbi:hypothetical protein [Microcoleus sp. B5-D4]|uniref:hypothetical protein n=1 Tax=Microcoleus sp. B5-D4 TaxID=2818681 RepID=UPI002FD74FE5
MGINGKSKYPLGGIDVFKLADGSVPSQGIFRKMEGLSWAIPIDTFQELVSHLKA